MTKILRNILLSFLAGIGGAFVYVEFIMPDFPVTQMPAEQNRQNAQVVNYSPPDLPADFTGDFIEASRLCTQGVV